MFEKLKTFFSSSKNSDKPDQSNQLNNAQFQKKQQQDQSEMPNANNNDIFNEQQYFNNSNNYYSTNNQGLKLLRPREQNKKIVAVVVTFCSGSSYDHLFTQVEQKTIEGTQVLVYSCDSGYLKNLIKAFNNQPVDDVSRDLIKYIAEVDPDCVVFNWECSSGYSGKNFSEGNQELFQFVRKLVDKGYMAMFSDFSLKALIAQWNQKQLGPNPFEQTGETSSPVQIRFKAGQLKECPSAQLQTVGEMAEEGKCNVGVAGGTIVYSVNMEKAQKSNVYQLTVLTVVTNIKAKSKKLECKIGQFSGNAGHVLLKFKNGGHILTSMTHWIELMKIDTSEQKLFQVAARQYGVQKANKMRMEYTSMPEMQQKSWISKNAVQFVQNQAPCTNMYRKNR